MTNLVITVPSEYISLGLVMQSALEQASKGKGRERHASEGEAYEDQIICEVARRVGLGYPLGQAVKKIYESQRIGGEKGVAELLGAINYIAAAIIVDREMDEHDRALFAKETAKNAERRAEAEGCCCQNGNDQPKFKSGDRVQHRVELPSVSDWIWRDATYLRPAFSWQQDGEHIVSGDDLGPVTVKDRDIRPAPKAEGCEALVEKDAPQTKEELFNRIVDCNPSTFGCVHKPTGEELAEMAEEDEKHG